VKKQYIYILIGVISSALIGLVMIQLYWIQNAVTLKEEGFKMNVRAVLAHTSNALEDIEGLSRIQTYEKRQDLYKRQIGLVVDSASCIKEDNVHNSVIQERFINGHVGFQFSFKGQLRHNRFPPIEERLNASVIDSVLRLTLVRKGLNAKYEYGVFDYDGNELIVSSIDHVNKLRQSDFYIELFPKDILEVPYFLTIHFPHKKSYLLKKMWMMLFTSVLLLVIIVWAFTFTIQTIFKQKKLSEIKNDFISNMTHELKTPISTISLACEALSDSDMSSDDNVREKYVGMISQENKRLGLLVERVLKSATWDKGDLRLKKDEFDLHEIITEVSGNILIQVENKSGNIVKKLNATTSLINADKVHVTNLIYNLLDNANKYSPLTPEIIIKTENLKAGILLTVSDKGRGIKREDLSKIFEKFYRVPTGNVHNIKGFGLGLNYVKAIVGRHGGEIVASSVFGKGTTFKIYLPFDHNEIS